MAHSLLHTAATLSALPWGLGARLLRLYRETRPGASIEHFDVVAALATGLPAPDARMRAARARAAAERALERAADAGLLPVPFGSDAYPTLLAAIPDAPPLLWVRGNPDVLHRTAVAIVGSRAASPMSSEIAHVLARDLSAHGVVIVSGLARGIDGAAHRGSLETGRTVGVLGSGADRIYPPEHTLLAEAIAADGAIVSELPPGSPPRRDHFPRRNRLISGMVRGVVVVEASIRSGSLVTARLALDQGREVLAVPGSVLGERHRGCHALLRDGAGLVERASDVLEALGLSQEDVAPGRRPAPEERGGRDPLLAVMVQGHPYDLQELMALSALPAGDVLARLLALELTGVVARIPGGRFFRPLRAVVR